MKSHCTKVIAASLLGITSTFAVGVGSTVDGRRDDGRKDYINEAQRKLRGNLHKALDDGVFETDLKEEKWVTGTELIGGELEADEDFEKEIYDRHDWNELLDIEPLVDLIEEESLGNDTHVWKELLTLTDGELGEEELLGMTASRDSYWLYAHNKRRKVWHEHYGKRYVPLKWSNNLKTQAQRFANHLASTNKFYHDRNRGRAGENLASNSGSSRRPTAESVVYRWVEAEMGKSPPANGHLTAALWRASKYLCWLR